MSNKDIINSYKNELFNKCIYNQIKEKSDILLNDILDLYNNDKDSFKINIQDIITQIEKKPLKKNLNNEKNISEQSKNLYNGLQFREVIDKFLGLDETHLKKYKNINKKTTKTIINN